MTRSPMQVDEEFRQKIKKIQKEIMKKKGKFESFPKITNKMIKLPEWEMMEKKMLGEQINKIEFRINFDGRGKK